MTSQVTINAHCVNSKEVVVRIRDKRTDETIKGVTLQDGESESFNVFDDREVIVSEIEKVS